MKPNRRMASALGPDSRKALALAGLERVDQRTRAAIAAQTEIQEEFEKGTRIPPLTFGMGARGEDLVRVEANTRGWQCGL